VKYLDDFATRRSLVLDGADTVVDVGANVGAYARLVRTAGFEGRIVSFEPLPSAFRRLSQAAASDSQWTCLPIGLTDETGVETLNVSQNLVSSSFLTVTSREARDAPETAVVDHVEAQVATLDSLRDRLFAPTERLFVKLDVQGAETRVLAGMPELLPQVVGIESELSILPLYEGQETLSRVVALLGEHGFRLIALEPEYRDLRSGELKQVNGLFVASA
jgi:FkbM family methyltransferase